MARKTEQEKRNERRIAKLHDRVIAARRAWWAKDEQAGAYREKGFIAYSQQLKVEAEKLHDEMIQEESRLYALKGNK